MYERRSPPNLASMLSEAYIFMTNNHTKFIMYNIRHMNICEILHDDYFNDSVSYIKLEKNKFCTIQPRFIY